MTLSPVPVVAVIAGKECRLSYAMRAVLQYQRETARIERSRPRPADPDPRCVCGSRRSEHKGPMLVRVVDDTTAPQILCPRFRAEDPFVGDSLFDFEAWRKIDINVDPERWLVCLWCGMHERQDNGTWKAPLTLAELEDAIGISPETRTISEKMFDALAAWMPKGKAPNAAAPGEPAQENPKPPSSADSGLAPASDTVSATTSS